MNILTCPKCHGEMRSYERGGVVVDQCADCRGVFLDRGELDHLISAEREVMAAPTGYAAGHPDPYGHASARSQSSPRGSRAGAPYRKSKRRSFLEDLFD